MGNAFGCRPQRQDNGRADEQQKARKELRDKGSPDVAAAAQEALPDNVRIVFVLGGPGSGKGTQCERIVAKYGHAHLSAGDLLRDEVKSGSELGKQCEAIMKEGKLVPMEVIIGLLRAAMVRSGGSSFLIDGFPRALDQAEMFERMVKPAELVLAFDCPEEVMEARLLKRGETSGRSDDNAATIRKRFETFVSQSMPVIAHYEQLGKCHRISAIPASDKVFEAVQAVVEGKAVATLAPPPDEDVQMVVPLAQGELHPEASVVFVLGGPGSGKGTQCERIVAKYGHTHLSAGDLLRDEVKSGSQVGKQCEAIMKEGKLVPMEVTIALLRNAMVRSGAKDFLIDGFPRAMDQALAFEQMIKPCRMVLAFDCPEEVMEARLLKRGETSGRSDDNTATIRKRFETFVSQSLPVISHYEQLGKCHRISAVPPPEEVFAMVCHVLEPTARASLTITSSGQLQQKQGLEVEPAAEVPAPALAFA